MASRGRSFARRKASPSPPARSLAELRVALETPHRVAVPRQGGKPSARRTDPSRGKNPREARQAWRAWSLAKSSKEMLWALAGRPAVPWFPLCRQRRRCSPKDGDGGSDMDVPVVLLLLWLVKDVLCAPILTVKKMEAALSVPNDGDAEIPSSDSNSAPATSMSNLVHRFQINKITRM